jgi:hypothetical protein
MASMDLQKVEQIMGQFEKQFEDLDVRTAVSIHMVVTVGDIFVRIIMFFTLCKSSGTYLIAERKILKLKVSAICEVNHDKKNSIGKMLQAVVVELLWGGITRVGYEI